MKIWEREYHYRRGDIASPLLPFGESIKPILGRLTRTILGDSLPLPKR